jgi:hypothetical protein
MINARNTLNNTEKIAMSSENMPSTGAAGTLSGSEQNLPGSEAVLR